MKSLAQGQQNLNSATQTLVTSQQAHSKDITELKKQMGQVIDFMGKIHEGGKLPSQTEPNPNVKAMITRSGRILDAPLQQKKKAVPSKGQGAVSFNVKDLENDHASS